MKLVPSNELEHHLDLAITSQQHCAVGAGADRRGSDFDGTSQSLES